MILGLDNASVNGSREPARGARSRVILAGAVLVTLGLGAAGCADGPTERFQAARAAAQDAEDLDDYLIFFTGASAELLRGSEATRKRDASLGYVPDARKVLPKGDVSKVDRRGGLTVLTVGTGHDAEQVRMVQEGDAWVIDGLSLPAIMRPLRGAAP